MIRNNIRNVVIGFAIGSLGVALAVTIPIRLVAPWLEGANWTPTLQH
jgi:hypothetical protein